MASIRKRRRNDGADHSDVVPKAKRVRAVGETAPGASHSFDSKSDLDEAMGALKTSDKRLAALMEKYPKPTFFKVSVTRSVIPRLAPKL